MTSRCGAGKRASASATSARSPARTATSPPGAARAGDDPRLRRAARGIISGRGPPRLPEHVLQHVGRVGALAHDAEHERKHERGIPVVEARERLVIACGHRPDELRPRRRHAVHYQTGSAVTRQAHARRLVLRAAPARRFAAGAILSAAVTTASTAQDWIARLALIRHPEGGWYRKTYRSREHVPAAALPSRFGGARVFG